MIVGMVMFRLVFGIMMSEFFVLFSVWKCLLLVVERFVM